MAVSQLITPENFINRYAITVAFNNGEAVIEEYIKLYEKPTVYKMLGYELTNLLYDDPTVPELEKLLTEFAFEGKCGEGKYCSGLYDILTAMIYAKYQREQITLNTSIGQMRPKVEAGELANDNYTNVFKLYNDAVQNSLLLQEYIQLNKELVYPTYKGTEFKTSWLI